MRIAIGILCLALLAGCAGGYEPPADAGSDLPPWCAEIARREARMSPPHQRASSDVSLPPECQQGVRVTLPLPKRSRDRTSGE